MMAAYRWLSENYQENDRIFLFGVYLLNVTQNLDQCHRIEPHLRVLPRRLPSPRPRWYDPEGRTFALLIIRFSLYVPLAFRKVGLIRRGNEEQIALYVFTP